MSPRRTALAALGAALGLMVVGCDREARRFSEVPPATSAPSLVTLSELQPGPKTPPIVLHNPYEENAWAVSEGKQLYNWMNCVGCHAHGGGGMGPPLMDAEWIYGSDPENVYETIIEGRPNGMPSFGGKLSNQQAWQLVAYVRSMSGLLPKDVTSGRSDEMQVKVQEQSTPRQRPMQAGVPKPSEIP